MSRQSLNLPINIPWRQIAVSPDMMDEEFCNKRFPFAWRSSMAISVYEPKPEDLPEELCGDRITYIKVTTSITGYQPTKDETELLDQLVEFPDFPAEKEDLRGTIERIEKTYFACYGVLLNVAVFPYPNTKKKLLERVRIDFSKVRQQGAPNNTPFLEPGSDLDSPYTHPTGVIFDPGLEPNSLVNLIHLGNGTDAELNLHTKMVIGLPGPAGLAAVEAKVAYLHSAGVKMEAFSANGLVGTATSETAPNQVHTLFIEAEDIQKVVITSPKNEASLFEFAYFVSKEVPLKPEDYPHIIDFEPKRRDLYQTATESGEILSGSKSALKTNKALIHTEKTENNITFGASVSAIIPIPNLPIGVKASGSTSQTNTDTDQERWSVETDASRERRETQGATTQLSQMYNLMTGYHAGTNRAAFLNLARPHVLQPTDFRTFVQGLRAIEGMQDYFLIVSRPEGIEGLCIEAALETGNFPEDTTINEPPEEYDEYHYDYNFPFTAKGGRGVSWLDWNGSPPQCIDIDIHQSLPGGLVIDQRDERKRKEGDDINTGWDEGHPGVSFLGQEFPQSIKNFGYGVTEHELTVTGELCGGEHSGLIAGDQATFDGAFRVFFRSEFPKTSYQEPYAEFGRLLVTSRGLCTCYKSGDCLQVVPVPPKEPIIVNSIVDEPIIKINKAIMTKSASRQNRTPLAKDFISNVQNSLIKSHRSTSRHAFDDNVGFMESDFFKEQVTKILPEDYLKGPIGKVRYLPSEVITALGDDFSIKSALELPLAQFTRRTGLSIKEASKARHQLLGISPSNKDNGEDKDKKQQDQE